MKKEKRYLKWRNILDTYLDLQNLRKATKSRLDKMIDRDADKDVILIMETEYNKLLQEEKNLLREVVNRISTPMEHEVWRFCQYVKGLGVVAYLTFVGYIDPYEASTAGRVRSFFGLIPDAKYRSGQKVKFNPEAKGRLLGVVVPNVIKKKDPYYYKLYLDKKQYYYENPREGWYNGVKVVYPPFKVLIEGDKSKCPRYKECVSRLSSKAQRLNREMKEVPCALHLHLMSQRWMAGILVSHVAEIMRRSLGLDTSSFRAHKDNSMFDS